MKQGAPSPQIMNSIHMKDLTFLLEVLSDLIGIGIENWIRSKNLEINSFIFFIKSLDINYLFVKKNGPRKKKRFLIFINYSLENSSISDFY